MSLNWRLVTNFYLHEMECKMYIYRIFLLRRATKIRGTIPQNFKHKNMTLSIYQYSCTYFQRYLQCTHMRLTTYHKYPKRNRSITCTDKTSCQDLLSEPCGTQTQIIGINLQPNHSTFIGHTHVQKDFRQIQIQLSDLHFDPTQRESLFGLS